MFASLAYNIKSLHIFRGRDTRSQFWPYAALVVGSLYLLQSIVSLIEFLQFMDLVQGGGRAGGQTGKPAVREAMIDRYWQHYMRTTLTWGALICLLAAPAARRVSDAGLSRLWVAVPVVSLAVSLAFGARMFDLGNLDPRSFQIVRIANLFCWGSMVVLVAMLAMPTSRRYRTEPAGSLRREAPAPAAIPHNLVNLANFRGADTRWTFWPYALLVLLALFAGFATIRAFVLAGDLESAGSLVTSTAILAILTIVLIGASVARRLRDSGRSPWWGLLPLPFFLVGLYAMRRLLSGSGGDMKFWMSALFINNTIYLLAVVALLILLAMPTSKRLSPQATTHGDASFPKDEVERSPH